MRPLRPVLLLALAVLAAASCNRAAGDPVACDVPAPTGALPAELHETSGLALGTRSGVFWTHNDSGGEAEVFAVDSAGRLLGRTRVAGARNRDWEDIDAGPCPTGACLYIADIGDNLAGRDEVVVYRVPEPAPGDAETPPVERFRFRYPDGPRDAEALFVLPTGEIYVVTKGRTDDPTLYRSPLPLRADEVVELEAVQRLAERPALPMDLITGAGASPGGDRVVVRSYGALRVYRFHEGRLAPVIDPPLDLVPLGEPQGEAVDIAEDGTIWLSTEAEGGGTAFLSRVSCRAG